MQGYLRRRGESWELRAYIGTDPVTGKQRYASRSFRGGKREAQRLLAEMVLDAQRGVSVRRSATVGDLLEAWFDLARHDFSPKTVKETRGIIDRNLLPTLGAVPLSRLKPSDLDRFYRQLTASGGARGAGLAPGTVRRIHGVLRRALGQGVKWSWLGVNPAVSTTPPRVPQPNIKPPSESDLVRLLRRATTLAPELACFLVLAAATGARRSELVALRWTDVDLANRTLTIGRGVVAGPNGLVEKDTKTHAARRVTIDEQSVVLLADHRNLVEGRARACRVELPGGSFVFSNEIDGSTPWYPDSVSRGFKRLCDLEGIDGVRLHDLRHFVATQLLSAGVDVRTVAGRLGHRNAATTLNVYAHFLEQSDQVAADIIGKMISTTPTEA